MCRSSSSSIPGSTRVERTPGNAPVVWLAGEHDLATTATLTAALDDVVSGAEAPLVLVDVSGLTFLSAATIGAIVGAAATLGARGGAMLVRAPSAFVRSVFDLCGLTAMLTPPAGATPAGARPARPALTGPAPTGRQQPDPNLALVGV